MSTPRRTGRRLPPWRATDQASRNCCFWAGWVIVVTANRYPCDALEQVEEIGRLGLQRQHELTEIEGLSWVEAGQRLRQELSHRLEVFGVMTRQGCQSSMVEELGSEWIHPASSGKESS
jgi:hypothetical protein